jgi:hypothetical protein
MIGLALQKKGNRSKKEKKPKRKLEHQEPTSVPPNKKRRPEDVSVGAGTKTPYQMSKTEMKERRYNLFRRDVEQITELDHMPMPSEEQDDAMLVGITGRRKSGKTFLLNKMMHTIWCKQFNKIYILSLTAKSKKQQKNYFGSWKGNIKYLEDWDESFFQSVRKELEEKDEEKHLIVIDDMSDDMRQKLYASNVDKFAFIGRHYRCSVVWLAQKITLFTPGFRQEADAFILFREENMPELRLLHREWGFGDMDNFICTLLENTLQKHSWIMLRNIGGTIHIMTPPPEAFSESKPSPNEKVTSSTSEKDKQPTPQKERKSA